MTNNLFAIVTAAILTGWWTFFVYYDGYSSGQAAGIRWATKEVYGSRMDETTCRPGDHVAAVCIPGLRTCRPGDHDVNGRITACADGRAVTWERR